MSRLFNSALLLFSTVFGCLPANANQIFTSGPQRVSLLELYTSQGCSSCPPIEAWFSRFTRDQALWDRLVPIAFHVTYWDYLGWRDTFGDALYDNRQRAYARRWRNRSGVYTPGIVLDGEEWRGWMQRTDLELPPRQAAGELRIELRPGGITASYKPGAAVSQALRLNLALLGFGISRAIGSGENATRTLRHDFVVLQYRQGVLDASGDGRYKGLYGPLQAPSEPGIRLALAAWVSGLHDPTPMQAVGGWLNAEATEAKRMAHTVAPDPSGTAGKDKAR